jgi:DNA invertase Pin-like site-specific DNA recombinase
VTATLPEWLRPTATNPRPRQAIRVAFLGRTSTDEQQDPTLSLPRQLTNSERALLPGMVIVAWFYDVESSRKELALRGSSTAWSKYDIGIQRDGGLNDLIAEATAPDRRFDVVICESIDRIARYTHQGTKIEHDLELAGIPLLAADEPIILDGQTNGRKRKRASQVLLRRTKQGVAEWYIIEMLEKSWDGFETHTGQGWNVGKPPYGYIAERHKHPVPAKRAQGKHKTKLEIDPVRSLAVMQIYAWRIDEKLSYRAIAERLNTDLDRYPPPQPVDPERAVGRWTGSAVREVLFNPKYTGHMVWNRRSTKDKLHPGKNNPREEWIVSAEPTHPAIVPIDTYVAAQSVAAARQRSRADAQPDTPNRHRQTRRVYALRSYVWCGPCQRRMFGRTVAPYTYYSCQPREREIPEGHPGTVSITEETLLGFATQFFNIYLLGPHRLQLAVRSIDIAAQHAADEHRRKIASLRHALTDITHRRTRLLRVLEEADDPDGSMFNDIRERRAQLDQDLNIKTAELAHYEATMPAGTSDHVELLTDLPKMQIDLGLLPTDRLRPFLDAFAIQITHDVRTKRVRFQATITDRDTANLSRLARTITPRQRRPTDVATATHDGAPADNGGGGVDLQICDMPRRGHTLRSGSDQQKRSPRPAETRPRASLVCPAVPASQGSGRTATEKTRRRFFMPSYCGATPSPRRRPLPRLLPPRWPHPMPG